MDDALSNESGDSGPWSVAGRNASAASEAIPVYADVAMEPSSSPLHFSITPLFLTGTAKGYLQTPAGGAPGSTSRNRPRLSELGIDSASIAGGTFGVGWEHHEVFAGAEIIRLSSSNTLSNDLITHGVTFPAGTRVSADVSLDWYRVGYRYAFDLAPAANDVPQWTIAPYAAGVLWNFDYSISGGGQRTSRGYLKPTLQGGVVASWRPGGGPFSLSADVSASPPAISSVPFLAAEQVTASYRFFHTGHFDLVGSAGVRFEQFNYHDDQPVSNHVRVDLGPMLIVGVGIGF